MMNRKSKTQSEVSDRRGGGYFLFPDCLLASAAWRAASPISIKLLMTLCARHNGRNNGKIALSAREAGEAIGSKNFHAISRAFGELEGLGLAVIAKDHPRLQRMAREYRLTFVPVGDQAATNEYADWRPGDAGPLKKRVAPTAAETNQSAEATAAGLKYPAEANAADERKKPVLALISAEDASTHIFNHTGSSRTPSSAHGKIAGGPFPKPTASGNASAPDEDELRHRVAAFVAEHGRGSQRRLAEVSGFSDVTLCRFLRGGARLKPEELVRLSCKLVRAGSVERRMAVAG